MIISQKTAKKLGYDMTINLKYIMSANYVNEIENKGVKNKAINLGVGAMMFLGFGFIISVILVAVLPRVTFASEKITYDNLQVEGMGKPPFKLYSRLKDECYKQEAIDKAHCIRTGLSIAFAESSWKDVHTPFGLQSKDKGYKKWVSSYNKYWYKATDGGYFYGNGKPAPTRYCTSEESSNTEGHCPNGKKNFNKVFYNLTF